MITGYYCTNIFSKQAKELIEFYREILEIPYIKTDVDESNGVYLGFIENAPTLCIWDCKISSSDIDNNNSLSVISFVLNLASRAAVGFDLVIRSRTRM